MYGMRPVGAYDPDQYIGKQWRVTTNDNDFAKHIDIRCDGSHRHMIAEGANTKATENYPVLMARSIHAALNDWVLRRAVHT